MQNQTEKEVIERLARIEEKVDHQNNSTKNLQREVYGNGKPGLKHRVTMLEERQKLVAETRKAASVWVRWALPLIVTVVSVGMAVLNYFSN